MHGDCHDYTTILITVTNVMIVVFVLLVFVVGNVLLLLLLSPESDLIIIFHVDSFWVIHYVLNLVLLSCSFECISPGLWRVPTSPKWKGSGWKGNGESARSLIHLAYLGSTYFSYTQPCYIQMINSASILFPTLGISSGWSLSRECYWPSPSVVVAWGRERTLVCGREGVTNGL